MAINIEMTWNWNKSVILYVYEMWMAHVCWISHAYEAFASIISMVNDEEFDVCKYYLS